MKRSGHRISRLILVLVTLFFQGWPAEKDAQSDPFPGNDQGLSAGRFPSAATTHGINALLIMENGFIDSTALYGYSGFKALL